MNIPNKIPKKSAIIQKFAQYKKSVDWLIVSRSEIVLGMTLLYIFYWFVSIDKKKNCEFKKQIKNRVSPNEPQFEHWKSSQAKCQRFSSELIQFFLVHFGNNYSSSINLCYIAYTAIMEKTLAREKSAKSWQKTENKRKTV